MKARISKILSYEESKFCHYTVLKYVTCYAIKMLSIELLHLKFDWCLEPFEIEFLILTLYHRKLSLKYKIFSKSTCKLIIQKVYK